MRARHRAGLAHALYLQHMMSIRLGRPEDDLGRRALAIFGELGDLVGQGNALNNLGIAAYYRGDWVEALEHYDHSRDVRSRSGDVVGTATEENNIAEILSDQGHFEEARGQFESARATWLAAGYRVGVGLATSNLGRLEARAGNMVRGRELLGVSPFSIPRDRLQVHAQTEVRLAECELLEGDFEAAFVHSTSCSARPSARLGQAEVTAMRLEGTAYALAQLASLPGGGTGVAVEPLDTAVESAEALDVPYRDRPLAICTLRPHLGTRSDGRPKSWKRRPSDGQRPRPRHRPVRVSGRPSGGHHLVEGDNWRADLRHVVTQPAAPAARVEYTSTDSP